MRWILILTLLTAVCGCETQQEQAQVEEKPKPEAKEVKPGPGDKVRPMTAAGKFYPEDADELRKAVEGYIKDAGKAQVEGDVVALIAPHAGYVFSGHVAGHAYAAVKGRSYDTVVVVGSHIPGEGVSALNLDFYRTPLGHVKVDGEVVRRLLAKEQFGFEPLRHNEHAIEVQMPFLQVALEGGFEVVALAVTDAKVEFVRQVARDLAGALEGKKALLVASTDLTHYPPYYDANSIDADMMEAWKTLDAGEILRREEELAKEHAGVKNLECLMCGKAAVAIVVEAAKLLGADTLKTLKYANSGDVPAGGRDEVVGYGAAVVSGKASPKREEKSEGLSEGARQTLLLVAREAITTALRGGRMPKVEVKTQELKAKLGVFVSLYRKGGLRGCIGCFGSEDDLPATVARYAVLSATADGRFPAVRLEEVPELEIKISVLSAPRKVESADEVEVGVHGIWVRDPATGRSGTYLPEVATEMDWDRDEFLSSCCREKAGLAADAWKTGKVEISVYTTQVFGDGK